MKNNNKLGAVLQDSLVAKELSYVMVWRSDDKVHFFFPYPGHPAAEDAKTLLDRPEILLLNDFTNLELTFIMITISFLSFNALSIGSHLIQGSITTFFSPLFEPRFLLSILYLGVLSSLITALLSNYVLSKIDASKMIVFSSLATVISIIAGILILKEDFFFYHIIGSILIIGGVLGTNFSDKIPFKN